MRMNKDYPETEPLCCTANLAEYSKMLHTFLELHSMYYEYMNTMNKAQANDSVFFNYFI